MEIHRKGGKCTASRSRPICPPPCHHALVQELDLDAILSLEHSQADFCYC